MRHLQHWAWRSGVLFAALTTFELPAKADIGVVLADPTTVGVSVYTHAGHSLVYLSGVCAASPVKARLCGAGEQGSIVTTYPDFRESEAYRWNLVPLSLYLDGSLTPDDRLLYGSRQVKAALEAHARDSYFQHVCEGHCPQVAHSFWQDLVDATAVRDVFIYAVHTTRAQDQTIVDWLNDEPNVNHYNGFTNNCAVFTRSLVNLIFPHAVHKDFPNDLGMMGPKAAARSFTHWAVKRPWLGFYSMHFAQQPGDMPRSGLAQSGTETAIHMKKYLIPAALIGDHEVAGSFFVSYFLTGRFGLYKEYAKHPDSSIVELEAETKAAKKDHDAAMASSLQLAAKDERAEVVGTKDAWEEYRERYVLLVASAEVREYTDEHKLYPQEYDKGTASVDGAGMPWLMVKVNGEGRRVGIGSKNVLAAESDPELAFELMLGRVGYVLRAKNHMRETMEEFEQDWKLLEQTRDRLLFGREQHLKVASDNR